MREEDIPVVVVSPDVFEHFQIGEATKEELLEIKKKLDFVIKLKTKKRGR